MLSKYIKSLIDIHSRVIVPDLGAFMLKGDASKTIYFNEFLRFNDGLLVDSIAEQEQIDKIEAAKKVKAFVDSISKQLSGNKSVELEGIGTLYLDINEKIQLRTSDTGAGAVVKQVEAEVETSPREILFELEKTEPEAPKPSAPASQEAVKAQVPSTPAPPQPKKTEDSAPVTKSEKPAKKAKLAAPSAPPVKENKTQPPKKEEAVIVAPNTNKRIILVAIFGILVISAIVYFAFFQSPKKNNSVNQNITIGATSKKDSNATKKDSNALKTNKEVAKKIENVIDRDIKQKQTKTQATAKIVENKATPAPSNSAKKEDKKAIAKSSNGKKFYVIAGTFSVENNADRMVKKLKDEGYAPDKLKNEAKNVFYVSYSSFAERESAKEEMNKLKSSGKADAWIYAK